MVKAALQLLHRMVHQGIFQPPLRPQVYLNTLRKAEAELEALLPKRQEEDEEAEGEAAGEDGAQWQPIQVRRCVASACPSSLVLGCSSIACAETAGACEAGHSSAICNSVRGLMTWF